MNQGRCVLGVEWAEFVKLCEGQTEYYWRTVSHGSWLLWFVAGANKEAREGRGDHSEKGV